MHIATKTNNTIAASNDYMFQYQTLNYPSTSQSSVNDLPSNQTHYACAKISNIPWDVSQNGVRHFFSNWRSPSLSVYTQSIHIMMDRTTGKTLSDAYVEFTSISDMRRAIEARNQKPLKGRIVSVTECSQEELLTVVFPKWRGQFHGTLAIPPASEIVRTMSTAAGGGNSGCPPFITREEINSLLVVCKNYKLHFSRKCAERPFENIISVIAKYPWHQSHLISTMHRDHIYEMLKLSIESLKTHLAKDYVQIDSTLLERLTRAGIMCPAFTERQKTTLLQTARIDCPADIESFLILTNCIALSPSTSAAAAEQQQFQQAPLSINTKQGFPFLKRDPSQELESNKENTVYPWGKNNDDNSLNDLLLSPIHSPISSLIRDIQQTCYFDEQSNTNQQNKKPSFDHAINNGLPLLLQPMTNLSQSSLEQHYQQKSERFQTNNFSKSIPQLSPWAPSYAPKTLSDDIWRMSTPVETTSKNLLTA
ncbi:hypothetical protein MFLAVUS_005289 [Mucor flavus]|uniref:RRM domain-containing protein n=1 Tax=Mucor flavus TaxID=439312 RepID=A0ABP9YYB4_9FUNG